MIPIGTTILNNDIDNKLMDRLYRFRAKLLVTMNNGEEIKTGVGLFYNELVFHGKFPTNLNKKDILNIKIID